MERYWERKAEKRKNETKAAAEKTKTVTTKRTTKTVSTVTVKETELLNGFSRTARHGGNGLPERTV